MNEKDYIETMEKISEEILHTSYLNLAEGYCAIDGELLDKICRKLVGVSSEYNREESINILKEYKMKKEKKYLIILIL